MLLTILMMALVFLAVMFPMGPHCLLLALIIAYSSTLFPTSHTPGKGLERMWFTLAYLKFGVVENNSQLLPSDMSDSTLDLLGRSIPVLSSGLPPSRGPLILTPANTQTLPGLESRTNFAFPPGAPENKSSLSTNPRGSSCPALELPPFRMTDSD